MNQPSTVSPFHAGEHQVQTRLGVRDRIEGFGQRFIRNYLPEEHSAFYSQLPFMLIGAIDTLGRPWATILMGRPGFVDSPDPQTLRINTRLVFGDPLQGLLSQGTNVGLLGIEYHSRRRNRATGKVTEFSDQSIVIKIDQTFGNCPQYIQAREYELSSELEAVGEPRTTKDFRGLDEHAQKIIGNADHFYIATHYSENADDHSHGADVSHRGGKPGFVRVEDERTLTFPDFVGNSHFNTMGNIALNPRAGLLFLDFENGDLLYLTCKAEIIWDDQEKQAFIGAERLVRFTLDQGLLIEKAVPIRWNFREYSPSLESTGSWEDVSDKLTELSEGNKYRDYRVMRVERESETITSFYLEPEERGKIPCHVAGQFLPIEIEPSGAAASIRRTYTISNAPNGAYFRLSIKREPPATSGVPPGVSSNYFHDGVAEGTIVRALSPRGKFTLNESSARPVVLISGGVGITPMISMLEQLVNDDMGCGCSRPIWFVHGAINSDVQAFGDHVRRLGRELPCLTTHIRYSKPSAEDVQGKQYDSAGYVDIELLKSLLPLDDYDFYLCGPPAFMESLYEGLNSLSINSERIHYEFFGPGASLDKKPSTVALIEELGEQHPVAVEFAQSGIKTTWDPSMGTLLDLAEAEGLQPAYSCRSGICQTCTTKISQGEVAYTEAPMAEPGEGTALICCSYPRADGSEDGRSSPLILDL